MTANCGNVVQPPERNEARFALFRAIDNDLFVFNAVLLIQGAVVLALGMALGLDSYKYTTLADELLRVHFNYVRFFHSEFVGSLMIFKIGFITVTALTKLVFGSRWQAALTVLNVLASACTGALVVRLTRSVTASRVAAWSALLMYTASSDILQWDRFVMTDSTFLLLSFGVAYFAGSAAVTLNRARQKWTGAAMVLLITVLYRPTGMLIAVPFLCCALVRWNVVHARPVLFWKATLAALILCIAAFVAAGWLFSRPQRWPLKFGTNAVKMLSKRATQGEVVESRSRRAPPQSLAGFFLLFVSRFVHFFQPAASGFSLAHNAYELLYFLPVYAGAIVAIVSLAMQRKVEGFDVFLLVSFLEIAAFAAFQAITIVDVAWRYRLPVLPHLAFLAAVGVARITAAFRRC